MEDLSPRCRCLEGTRIPKAQNHTPSVSAAVAVKAGLEGVTAAFIVNCDDESPERRRICRAACSGEASKPDPMFKSQ